MFPAIFEIATRPVYARTVVRKLGFGAFFFSVFSLAAACKTPETAKRDMAQDARKRCDRGDGAACFHAGSLAAEEPGGDARAAGFHAKGCALKVAASCDAIAASKSGARTDGLAGGCNAGDLLSCARVADDFAKDPARAADAKALREQTCRMGAAVNVHTTPRDLFAAAEGCNGLARTYSKGDGVKVDTVLATKLDILATVLRTEALARFDRLKTAASDADNADKAEKTEKPPAQGAGAAGAQASEADRVQRLKDANKAARAALIASIDAAARAQAADSMSPIAQYASPTEPIFWPGAAGVGNPALKCQKCVEGCGDMKKCAGADDFAGGRCGALKGTDKFETCVAECTAKADSCVKACGDCSAAPGAAAAAPATPAANPPPADPNTAPPAVDEAARCRESGDRIICAVAGGALEKQDAQQAFDLYVAACTKKAESCSLLVTHADQLFKRREGPRAVQALDKACQLNSGLACARLGIELEEGERGVPADLAKATKSFEKGCDLGVARACIGLATMIDDGRGTPKNPARSKAVRAKFEALDKAPARTPAPSAQVAADEEACRKSKDAARCIAAGSALQDIDAVKAEEVFRIGCSANKNVCGLWAFAIDRFRKDDTARGTRILEQGCSDGSALACLVFADVNRFGYRAAPRADGRVLEVWNKACELGDPTGCRGVASRNRGGIGIAKSATRADEIREKAFKADEESGKKEREAYEKWLERAAGERAREPYAQELDRRKEDLRALVERTRGKGKAGSATEKSAPPSDDVEQSALREGAIKRMAKTLFLTK